MAKLGPCAGCGRHVRAIEGACPFCGTTRRSRTLAVIATAGVALALSGCDVHGTALAQDDDDSADEPVRMTPQYGAPSYDPGPPPTPQPLPPDNRDAGPPRGHDRPGQGGSASS